MAGKLAAFCLLFFISKVYSSACPSDTESILPCVCRQRPANVYEFECLVSVGQYNFTHVKDNIADSMKDQQPIRLFLRNMKEEYIPGDFFEGLTLGTLGINNAQFDGISSDAFKGSEESMTFLMITSSQLDHIPAKALSNMNKLMFLGLQKSKISAIVKSEMDLLPSILETLLLGTNNITSIEPNAFQRFTNLRHVVLSGNDLSSISGVFPNKMLGLYLNSNQLTVIPVEAIKNMQKGSKVHLEKNRITSIPEEGSFKPILDNGVKIYLAGNKVRCDCGSKWIIPYRTLIYGLCAEGSGKLRSSVPIPLLDDEHYNDC